MERIDLYGVPSSMGAYAPGQEAAPSALRGARLAERLRRDGIDVHDHGDSTLRRWFPDRDRPDAQHVSAVAEVVRETATRVADANGIAVVLGGDCTIGLGTVAGIRRRTGGRIGLLYFDLHADMHVPSSMREGALDSMGTSHALALPGSIPELVEAFDPVPLLEPQDLWLFGLGAGTTPERARIAERAIRATPFEVVAADPEGTAQAAISALATEVDQVAIHLDVDVIDFMDLPLSENADRNLGLSLGTTMRALGVLLSHPSCAALTIAELNPDHDPDGTHIGRFVEALARAVPSPAVTEVA